MTIEIPGEQPLKIERESAAPAKKDAKDEAPPAEPGKLKFAGFPPEGKKLKDATAADTLVRAVASIDLEDVRKLAATPGGPAVSTVKIEQTDAPNVTLRLRKDGDATWLSVTATGEGDEAKKAAAEITSRTQGWEYKLPTFKAESILKKRAELLDAGT